MSRMKCCVPGCLGSRNSGTPLHRFPNPSKYRSLFDQWVAVIGGDIISLGVEGIYKRRSVCNAHFEDKYQCRFNRLSNIAVPTLYLPGSTSTTLSVTTPATCAPQPPQLKPTQSLPLEPKPAQSLPPIPKPAQSIPPEPKPAQSSLLEPKPAQPDPREEVDPLDLDVKLEDEASEVEPQCAEEPIYEVPIKKEVTAVMFANEPVDANKTEVIKHMIPLRLLQRLKLGYQTHAQALQPGAQLQQSASTPSFTNLPHIMDSSRLLTELTIYKKKYFALRAQLYKLRSRKKALESSVKNLKRYSNDKKAMFEKLTVNMSAPAKALFEMQLQSKKKIKGRRYSLPGRIIALSIYKASPSCYMMLSKYFVLPSVNILNRFLTSVKAATDTNIAKETEPIEPDNEENQDMMLNISDTIDSIDDLDLDDYNINSSFQHEIDETNSIVNETQVIKNQPQGLQTVEVTHQVTDGKSGVQSVELSEGQAIQLPDGRIFQLINGRIIEMDFIEQENSNLQSVETHLTGLSDELHPAVNNLQSTQECGQDGIMVKPLRSHGSAQDKLALLSETPPPQAKVTSMRQKIIKPKSFDGNLANVVVDIHNALSSKVEEHSKQINHPQKFTKHQAKLNFTSKNVIDPNLLSEQTKYNTATNETTRFSDFSRMNTPDTSLKRVATDEEPQSSRTSAVQMYDKQKVYRKRLKTKETVDECPDMPDLTFS